LDPASTLAGPAWLQLGGAADDVSFPVIATPPPSPAQPASDPSKAATAWTWGDADDEDDDDEEGDGPGVEDYDEQIEILDDGTGLEILDEDEQTVPSAQSREARSGGASGRVALPVVPARDWNEDRPPVETATDHPADFTLSRSGPMTVEELDLAPMVDVAFQLVLFFMVTATTVLYKTLEIPKPNTEPPPGAVAQGHSRSLDDFKDDYVLVEIDATGAMKIDHEPVPAELGALAERLRTAREKTGRKAMLLSADYATPHRNAVLAYDAANEIGMGIAIARPSAPQGPGPGLFPGAAPARGGATAPRPAGAAAKPARPAPAPTAPAPSGAPFD
jgi:biopolymer transport protein ExbD